MELIRPGGRVKMKGTTGNATGIVISYSPGDSEAKVIFGETKNGVPTAVDVNSVVPVADVQPSSSMIDLSRCNAKIMVVFEKLLSQSSSTATSSDDIAGA